MEQTCPKCGGNAADNGTCTNCGAKVLVELEIGAFMGPHIKRARIVLAVVGVLYLVSGARAYSKVTEAMRLADAYGARPEVKHTLTLVYVALVFVIISGIANIVLAAIA